MTPILVLYHCLFTHGNPRELRPAAMGIVFEAMQALEQSGLLTTCNELVVGINGEESESGDYAKIVLPQKAKVVWHGLNSFAENLTLVWLEKWAKQNPGWFVCYFHAKGATHHAGSSYGENVSKPWRQAMTKYLIDNWRECVAHLMSNQYDVVCTHWMWNMADGTQHIPAGNFLWTTSNFVRTLPSIFHRERIKMSGIAAAESRFESEVYWGNGPKPRVKQYLPNGGEGCP